MVSTRSKAAQTHIEDFATSTNTAKPKATKATSGKGKEDTPAEKKSPKTKQARPKKRKSPSTTSAGEKEDKPAKAAKSIKKSATPQAHDHDDHEDEIIINRAPVLQLWGACVTRAIYPSLSWESCISAGSAVSAICAVAKGRSIGTISEPDDPEAVQEKSEKAKEKQSKLDEIQVMQFKLKLKDGLALVGSDQKGKPGNEEALKKKFGAEEYDHAKGAFENALKTWEGEGGELNRKAFGLYEKFRPDVKSGQKGWGRKGELDLAKVKSVVEK